MSAIKISDIKLDTTIYPRVKHDDETVTLYRTAIDNLPPITITNENWLVDGYHRYLAHIAEGRQEIATEVLNIPKEQILVEAIRRNAIHGKQLTRLEKRQLAQQLYPMAINELAQLLGVTERSVRDWTADQRRNEDEARNERIWQAWLVCKSTREIGEAENLSQETVANITNRQLSERFPKLDSTPPPHLQLYDVWNFPSCAEEYGNPNYPGRIPGQIIENVLWYFTKPGDVVIDPVAGGGTTIDVCKVMGRRYLAYDLQPSRPDIQQHNARQPFPLPASITKAVNTNVSLVFLDPPYWKQRRGEYVAGGLDGLELNEFYIALLQIIDNAQTALGDNGYIALIIGPTQEGQQVFDHAADLIRRVDLSLARRIIVPYNTQQHGGAYVNAAKENRYPLYLYRDLLVWKV